MQASFIIINYNSWDDVFHQIDAIRQDLELITGEAEWLVVDNHSTDQPTVHRPVVAGVRYVDLPMNGGFAAFQRMSLHVAVIGNSHSCKTSLKGRLKRILVFP